MKRYVSNAIAAITYTNPSRPQSKGLEASPGASLYLVVSALDLYKTALFDGSVTYFELFLKIYLGNFRGLSFMILYSICMRLESRIS